MEVSYLINCTITGLKINPMIESLSRVLVTSITMMNHVTKAIYKKTVFT